MNILATLETDRQHKYVFSQEFVELGIIRTFWKQFVSYFKLGMDFPVTSDIKSLNIHRATGNFFATNNDKYEIRMRG